MNFNILGLLISILVLRAQCWCPKTTIVTPDQIWTLDFSPNQALLAAGLQNYQVILYDPITLVPTCTYNIPNTYRVRSSKFLQNSLQLAIVQDNNDIIFITSTCTLIRTFTTGHTNVYAIDFSVDGTKMMTCGSDGFFRIWDIITDVSISAPTLIASNANTGLPIWSCRFYIDSYIMVGDSNGQANLYYPNVTLFQQWIPSSTGIAYQVDPFVCKGIKFFLIGSGQNSYFSNDTQPFYSSTGPVYVAKVDQSNNFIAVGDSTGTLHIQPTANFNNIQSFTVSGSIQAGDFTDLGMLLAVGGSNKLISLFDRCVGCVASQNYISNYCSGSTSAVNVSCMTIFKSSGSSTVLVPGTITISDFYSYFVNDYIIQSVINSTSNLIVTTQMGPHCNTLQTTFQIYDTNLNCDNFLNWKNYFYIDNTNLTQNNAYCQNNKFVVQWNLLGAVQNYYNLIVMFPQNWVLLGTTIPLLNLWNDIFTKKSAGYGGPYPILYSAQDCVKKDVNKRGFIIISVFALLVMIIGVVSAKIIGLQLFGILQLAYFNLANHQILDINLLPLADFKLFNGPNFIIFNQNIKGTIPGILTKMGLRSQFLNNLNIMGFISVIFIISLFVINRIAKLSNQQKIRYITSRLLYQSSITLALFNAFNIGFSTGLHAKYAENNSDFHRFGTFCIIVDLSLIIIMLICLRFLPANKFGQFKDKFKSSFENQNYIAFQLMFRVFIGIYISYQNQSKQATIYAVGFALFFLIYNLVCLPFKDPIHNYRACTIHTSTLIILLVSNYYRSMKANATLQIKGHLHNAAYIQITAIVICLIVSIMCLVYDFRKWIIKFWRQKQKDQKVKGIDQTHQTIQEIGKI